MNRFSRSGVRMWRTHTPLEDALAPVMADPVEHDVAAQDGDQAERQRDPPAHDAFVGEHARREDRNLLRDGHAQPGAEEHQEQTDICELFDERFDQESFLSRHPVYTGSA